MGAPWPAARKRAFAAMWRVRVPAAEIAAHFNISEGRVYNAAGALGLGRRFSIGQKGPRRQAAAPAVAHIRRRPCLRCGKGFPSAGAHNRVCDLCKMSTTWRSGDGYAVNTGGRTRAPGTE